jgi:hypothetical protein
MHHAVINDDDVIRVKDPDPYPDPDSIGSVDPDPGGQKSPTKVEIFF